jgi:hypothetical protein
MLLVENDSAIPHQGGGYLHSRCILGLFPGLLVGMCHYLLYSLLASISCYTAISAIDDLFGISNSFYYICTSAFLFISFALLIFKNGKQYWSLVTSFAIMMILIIVIYSSSIRLVHLPQSLVYCRSCDSNARAMFRGGFHDWIQAFPTTHRIFLGLDVLSYFSYLYPPDDASRSITRSYKMTVAISVILSLILLFISYSIEDSLGTLYAQANVMASGYKRSLGLSNHQVIALTVVLPNTTITIVALSVAMKIFRSMIRSNLFPFVVKASSAQGLSASMLSALVSWVVCIVLSCQRSLVGFTRDLILLLLLILQLNQVNVFVRRKISFPTLKGDYTSP